MPKEPVHLLVVIHGRDLVDIPGELVSITSKLCIHEVLIPMVKRALRVARLHRTFYSRMFIINKCLLVNIVTIKRCHRRWDLLASNHSVTFTTSHLLHSSGTVSRSLVSV